MTQCPAALQRKHAGTASLNFSVPISKDIFHSAGVSRCGFQPKTGASLFTAVVYPTVALLFCPHGEAVNLDECGFN